MTETDWSIAGALAFICAILASSYLGVFTGAVDRRHRLLSFALVYGNCFLIVALGYFAVKWLAT